MGAAAVIAAVPVPPVATPVNTTGQAVMTAGVLAGLIIIAVVTVRLGRRWSTVAPLLIAGSTLIAGFMEPIPDAITNMWYYRPGQVTFFTSYGVSLPIWVYLSYTSFYGGFGLLFWWMAERGFSRRLIVRAMAGMWMFAVLTEVVGTRFGTYTYYGSAPFRVAGFPIWVSLGNVAICATLGIAAARLRRWLPVREALAPALLLGPAVIAVGLIGTGFPVINVIHTIDPSNWQLYPAAIASLAMAATMAYFATRFVPPEGLSPIHARQMATAERRGTLAAH